MPPFGFEVRYTSFCSFSIFYYVFTIINKIVIWLNADKLYLNVKKLILLYLVFSNKRISNTNDIVIDNQLASRVSYTKFFIDFIDEELNWTEHVNNLKIKLAKGSGKCEFVLVLIH